MLAYSKPISESGRIWQNLPESGSSRASFVEPGSLPRRAQFRPRLEEFGPIWAEFGGVRANFGRIWMAPGQVWRFRAKFGRVWPNSADSGPMVEFENLHVPNVGMLIEQHSVPFSRGGHLRSHRSDPRAPNNCQAKAPGAKSSQIRPRSNSVEI